jgi:hypothetical protein
MSSKKMFLCGVILLALGIAGCSSNTSSSSGFGGGSGYAIDLRVTNSILPPAGQTTLTAVVRDANGNPVNDSSVPVTFTSTLGAGITGQGTSGGSNTAFPTGGVATAIYTAPGSTSTSGTTTTSGVDQVTASYRGAFAFVSIYVSP